MSDNMKMGPYINGLYHNCNRNVKTVVGHYALNKFYSDFVSAISRLQNRDQTGQKNTKKFGLFQKFDFLKSENI